MVYELAATNRESSLENALKSAPLLPLKQIWDYLRSISPEDLKRYASILESPVGLALRVTASSLEAKGALTMSCSYLDQHIDLIHDWHCDQSEYNDLN